VEPMAWYTCRRCIANNQHRHGENKRRCQLPYSANRPYRLRQPCDERSALRSRHTPRCSPERLRLTTVVPVFSWGWSSVAGFYHVWPARTEVPIAYLTLVDSFIVIKTNAWRFACPPVTCGHTDYPSASAKAKEVRSSEMFT